MNTLLRMLLAALAATEVAAQPVQPLLAKDGVQPLSLAEGKRLFRQCSRQAPAPTANVWRPSKTEIQALEERLPQFVQGLQNLGAKAPPRTHSYHRQYFGFTHRGKKFIYGNFFPPYVLDGPTPTGALLVVCDGGPAFWGVVYNVASREFEQPAFNGPA